LNVPTVLFLEAKHFHGLLVGYHLYVDEATGLSYAATLARSSLVNNRSRKESFYTGVSEPNIYTVQPLPNPHLIRVPICNPIAQHLQVYESNEMPHTYTTFVKYTRAGQSSKDMLAPKGSLDSALFVFKKFFHMKTGLEWKDRFNDSKVPGMGSPDQGWFRFERPTGLMAALNMDAERVLDGEEMEEAGFEATEEDATPEALASVDDI
jgi:WGR domain